MNFSETANIRMSANQTCDIRMPSLETADISISPYYYNFLSKLHVGSADFNFFHSTDNPLRIANMNRSSSKAGGKGDAATAASSTGK